MQVHLFQISSCLAKCKVDGVFLDEPAFNDGGPSPPGGGAGADADVKNVGNGPDPETCGDCVAFIPVAIAAVGMQRMMIAKLEGPVQVLVPVPAMVRLC